MIITIGNFKGGVGKTTATALFGYILSQRMDQKVLCVDTDPQSNLTSSLKKTFKDYKETNQTIFDCLFYDIEISKAIVHLDKNLSLLSGDWNMINFEAETTRLFKKQYHDFLIASLIEEIKLDYDYILIDTAPATDLVMDNVITATDYVVITTQTVPLAFESTQMFYNYLLEQYHLDQTHFELLGVLPYLVGKSATDRQLLEEYQKVFSDEIFQNTVRASDRVKTWSVSGITEDKPYDLKTLKMYEDVVTEALEKMKERTHHETQNI